MKTLTDKDAHNPFSTLVLKRPRLMANDAAIDRVRKAIDGDDAGRELKSKVIEEANTFVGQPPIVFPSGDPLKASRKVLNRMQALGMAWLLEKKPVHATQAKLDLLAICRLPDWKDAKFLTTAEMTHAAAIGYDWFHDELTPAEREQCVTAILEKGLIPGLKQFTGNPDPAWPSRTSNWNIVCNASLMIAALAVADATTPPTLEVSEVFHRCLDSVPTGFRGYSPDGSWDEGPGYWNYATAYAAYLLSALQTAVGHEFGLGDLPGVRNSGYFRMHAEGAAAASEGSAQLFNYSDGETTHRGSWCMRWLFLRYGLPEYNRVAVNDGRFTAMDLLWFSKDATDGNGVPRNAVFRGVANVAMMRGKSSSDSAHFRPWEQHHLNEVYVGIRAGANSVDNHHGHLDLGSFVLDAQQLRWAIDIPPLEKVPGYANDYDLPGFFDVALDKRFRYYRTGTIGHNTLLIDEKNQALNVQAEIVAFAAKLDLVVAVVDLTAAYPDFCLRLRRGFALINRQHVLIVDEMTPKLETTPEQKGIKVTWQMHTMADATVDDNTARLTQNDTDFYARILEPAGTVFKFQVAKVTDPDEAPNDNKLMKLVATLPAVAGPTRLAVYLSSEREPVALPTPLDAPLWRWIEWTGEPAQRRFRTRWWHSVLDRLMRK